MKICECNVCDHVWRSRVDEPKQCPRCKTNDWRRKRKVFPYDTATERPVIGKDKRGLILGKEKKLRKA